MESIPEYIEGIPTNKHCVKERFLLIQSYYEKLWKKLQRETKSNYIRNVFMDAKVFIVKNESDNFLFFSPIKDGVQKKNGYKLMPT